MLQRDGWSSGLGLVWTQGRALTPTLRLQHPVVRTDSHFTRSKPGHSPSSGAKSRPPCHPRALRPLPQNSEERKTPLNDLAPEVRGVTRTGWMGPRADRWEVGCMTGPTDTTCRYWLHFYHLSPSAAPHSQKPQTQGLRSCPSRVQPLRATDTVRCGHHHHRETRSASLEAEVTRDGANKASSVCFHTIKKIS